MSTEQFTQVIEAILAGKYSWACLLILRFAGYNPLHYIPYRTFNRLIKENTPLRKSGQTKPDEAKSSAQNSTDKIPDLAYLNSVDREDPITVRGGYQLAIGWGDRRPFYGIQMTDNLPNWQPQFVNDLDHKNCQNGNR
jgi:hypothetical protein